MEPPSRAIVLHPLADLSHAVPPFFVQHLLEAFTTGTGGKSGSKFVTLRQQLVKSLPSAPPPGPATFVANCLQALLYVKPPHNEGLGHLLISALSMSDRSKWPPDDASAARTIAASLFSNAITEEVLMEPRIVVRLPVLFGIELTHIAGSLELRQCSDDEDSKTKRAKELLDKYVLRLLKDRSYTSAVSLLKSFNLQRNDYETLVSMIIDDGQTSLAVEWAAHLGKEMLKFLIAHCIKTSLFKVAYRTAHQYNLEEDFPGVYYLYRQSTLRKLVNKGLWDVAESIAEEDPQLVDYLLNLALEDNDFEKVSELCEHFHLDEALILPDPEERKNVKKCYLELQHFVPEEKVYWVDDCEGLSLAERHLIGVKIVGIDCEWKANRTKGVGPNKVSILQVASSESVFIFDLIILSEKHRSALNRFVQALFHSPNILKLGYAVHNDFERLLHSYKEVEAFRVCESVLDLQKVFDKEANKGGLSGLAKSVLGNCLNKQTRMSDWECRPLSKKQLHYAALDAAVLLPIYNSIACNVNPSSAKMTDLKKFMTSLKVVSGHKGFCGKGDAKRSPGHYNLVHSHDDLVLESCELLGSPIPGLLKAELFQLTQAAKLPPPMYTSMPFSFLNATAYLGTVKVAGTTFSGRLFSSKKDAEFSAAQVALTKLNQGLNTVESSFTNSELQQRGLQILQACGDKSSIGCAKIEQKFKVSCKSNSITGSKFGASASPFELSFVRIGNHLLRLC